MQEQGKGSNSKFMKYFDELKQSMEWLATKPDSLFVGQAVEVPGTAMFNTLKDVQKEKKLELPVFEDTQLGLSIGMSLLGHKIISIFPRWNFLICATNQLVSHLDKFPIISEGEVQPGVIIRTSVGSEKPLFPGHQHIGNMSSAYREMLSTVEIIELYEPKEILQSYKKAYEREDGKSTILVEFGDFYNEK